VIADGLELYLRLPSVAPWTRHEVTFTFTVYRSQTVLLSDIDKQWISGFLYHVVIFNVDKSHFLCMDEI